MEFIPFHFYPIFSIPVRGCFLPKNFYIINYILRVKLIHIIFRPRKLKRKKIIFGNRIGICGKAIAK
jgi:hypothetical protein